MEELKAILITHAKRYPLMQPTDAVKLIYQNEFGGGHLIRDEQACLNYLRREYASVEKGPTVPLYEDIGNGIVRVNLAAVKPEDLEQLGQNFIASAAKHKGTLDDFLNKLHCCDQHAGKQQGADPGAGIGHRKQNCIDRGSDQPHRVQTGCRGCHPAPSTSSAAETPSTGSSGRRLRKRNRPMVSAPAVRNMTTMKIRPCNHYRRATPFGIVRR